MNVMSTGVVVVVIVFALCGVTAAVVQLVRGDTGLRSLRDESPETRRAVRRAIRDGRTDDARVDQLARWTIQKTPRVRWAKFLFGGLLVLSILQLIFSSHTAGQIVLHSAQAALWTVMIVLGIVNQRRLDGYRGLDGTPFPTPMPPTTH